MERKGGQNAELNNTQEKKAELTRNLESEKIGSMGLMKHTEIKSMRSMMKDEGREA